MKFNNNHSQILEYAKQQILNRASSVLAIYVFGSFGNPYETTSSDLDLAILSTTSLDSVELWTISQNIAIEIDRDVDLIDLQKASTVFRFQVITTGTRIYCKDEKKCDVQENFYISRYLHLNEERAEILQSFTGT